MNDYELERHSIKRGFGKVCGIDEVGRGAIFGPVVAGAVILDPENLNLEIRDSKQLSPKRRLLLASDIYRRATAYSIGWCWNDEIDSSNILLATKQAMRMAVRGLQTIPDYALIDGMMPDFLGIPGEGIMKGDQKSLSIAAAAIIAKVFRDQLITSFSRFFPAFGLEKNKGYPTQYHADMVSLKGNTAFHRRSFKLKNGQRK